MTSICSSDVIILFLICVLALSRSLNLDSYENSEVSSLYHKTFRNLVEENLPEVSTNGSVDEKTEDDGVEVSSFRDWKRAQELLKKRLSLIYNRYEFYETNSAGHNMFLTSNNIDKESFEILKLKFASKILGKNESFLMIFGGSSVTAGKI